MPLPPDFAQGWLRYGDHHPGDTEKRIVLPVFLGEQGEIPLWMIADTGAPWTLPNFIGYGGLLEWIRSALDPLHNRFWFGEYTDGQG